MSDLHKSTKEDIAVKIITAPFLAIASAFHFSKKVLATNVVSKPVQSDDVQIAKKLIPEIFKPQPVFSIADKVHSQMFGSLKVCFYQYVKGYIRVIARKNGITKTVFYTPDIAEKSGVSYNMDSAIAWVREVGFKDAISQTTIEENQPVLTEHKKIENQETIVVKEVAVVKSNVTSINSPAKNRPFNGKIISMGETTRPGREGKPPYLTYAIKLRSESGGLEKEFLGEHLSELSEKMTLKVGHLVRIQLLGRNKFDVEINGKIEERHRNEFSIDFI